MRATFKSPTLEFMASDGDEKEAQRVFRQLAEGGEVTMPLQGVFWGGTFGTVTDRYGIDWMVSRA